MRRRLGLRRNIKTANRTGEFPGKAAVPLRIAA
jgi:hypothetical protein